MRSSVSVPFLSFEHINSQMRADALSAFERFYDAQWYILGKEVADFEAEYALFNQVKQAVGVSNGLDALILALRALGIGPGDEILIPSNTYIATWIAASHVGATIVPVEPDPCTYNLDPARLEAALTPRTKVIMPVHLYGQACEMQAIMAFAHKHGLYVVEDNAQAQGAMSGGQFTGSFGQVNATSFYPGKNLGAFGDAGAVTTDLEAYADQIRVLRNYGSAKKYVNEVIGYNMRMDELQAALLRLRLRHLAVWTAERQRLAAVYQQALAGVDDLILPVTAPQCTHVYHLYVIRTSRRDALADYLKTQGIGTLIHYPIPPHLQQAYQHLGFAPGAFPIAEELARTCLSLPIYPGLSEEQQAAVIANILEFYKI